MYQCEIVLVFLVLHLEEPSDYKPAPKVNSREILVNW